MSMDDKVTDILDVYFRVINKQLTNDKLPKDYGIDVMLYPSEIHVIGLISSNPEINSSELAGRMGVTRGAVSQIIRRLEEKGILSRHRKGGNEKEFLFKLEERGVIACDSQEKLIEMFYKRFYEKFRDVTRGELNFLKEVFLELESFVDMRIEHGERGIKIEGKKDLQIIE